MPIPKAGFKSQVLSAAIMAVTLMAILLGWHINPDTRGLGSHEQLGLPPCSLERDYDFPCPTCGMTTAYAHGVQLHFISAIRTQPFGFALAICIYLTSVAALIMFILGKNPYRNIANTRLDRFFIYGTIFFFLSWVYKIIAYKLKW